MLGVEISNKDTKLIAVTIFKDIKSYIKNNNAEYQKFIETTTSSKNLK